MENPTIAAPATPPARSAIGVIRVSGTQCFKILKSVFEPSKNKIDYSRGFHFTLGFIKSGAEIIDQVMVAIFKAPASYTGEDMAEISCHGNPLIVNKILTLLVSRGCTLAAPGEFTRRAYLNGKMDLSAAEAVNEISNAHNEAGLKISLASLLGVESKTIAGLRESMLAILAGLEAGLDFPDDAAGEDGVQKARTALPALIKKIDAAAKGARESVKLKEGYSLVITGRPNCGKSSLMNRLLKKERSIVTEIPGTTRDTVEDFLEIGGLPFRVIDTAGLRETSGKVEKEGVKRAKKAVKNGDVIIFLLDSSKQAGPADDAVFKTLKNKKTIIAINKIDLAKKLSPAAAGRRYKIPESSIISLSAKSGRGLNLLTEAVKNTIMSSDGFVPVDSITALGSRHAAALEAARAKCSSALAALYGKGSPEKAAADLKQAAAGLSLITGAIAPDDVLDSIFKNFCVGK